MLINMIVNIVFSALFCTFTVGDSVSLHSKILIFTPFQAVTGLSVPNLTLHQLEAVIPCEGKLAGTRCLC